MTARSKIIDIHQQRPQQRRTFDTQAAELGLDLAGASPPESTLGYALLSLLLDPLEFGPTGYINLFLPRGTLGSMEDMPPISLIGPGVINVAPGCWVDEYQSDFLIDAKAPGSKIIARGTLECDGHDYHDRTPEQASKDRKRDRHFQDQGIWVLRFTATQIVCDPKACAREAIRVLFRRSVAGGRE